METPPTDTRAEAFRCPTCDAELTFDAASQALRCAHCDATVEIQATDGEGDQSIVEYDLESGLAVAERGLGVDRRAARCGECGAVVTYEGTVAATRCDFCGSAQVLDQTANRRAIRPESLVPFQVDRDRAIGAFARWLGRLWFRPSDLTRRASTVELMGVYVPYWAFDARVHSQWTAQAGTYYWDTERYTTTDAGGRRVTRTRRVRKVRWRWTRGERTDRYDDLLVCGSRGLPEALADRLEPFDTRQLVPYRAEYLAGWRAEEYAVDLNDAWALAVSRMESSQRARCARDVPGDTYRFLRVRNEFFDERFKHVLLPVWVAAYRYRDRVYRFLVNGQTGEVVGAAPWSAWKISGVVALAIAAIAAVWWFAIR
ncbi:MAG: hypothetical protein D6689_02790 [Deltaproteobacteria bacterium]|nr:MAG: hypothetical protein D6689_02790 [Deltaproteobacteria bacterium]